MTIHKILVATDFSPASDAALDCATELARGLGSSLEILHVVAPPIPFCSEQTLSPVVTLENHEDRALLEQCVPSDPTVAYRRKMEWGLPADTILAMALADGADMIVMGTHGRTGLDRFMMGSVAEQVTRRAPCPVVTVNPIAAKQQAASPSDAVASGG